MLISFSMSKSADMLAIIIVTAVAVLSGAVVARHYWRRAIRWAESMREIRTRIWDVAALMRLFPEGYVPPSINDWTASPDLLTEIARQVRKRRPSILLELGSGVSTLVTASVLMRNGHGRLYSLDHEADYAVATAVELEQAGLHAFAEVRHAPLAKDSHPSPWYDESAFVDIDTLDLAIIDGPPTDFDPKAREPALEALWPRLAIGGLMIFDDADRPGDRQVIQAWAERCPGAKVMWLPLEKGCALIEKFA
jgi:predicted O-methyltransferase YrrM